MLFLSASALAIGITSAAQAVDVSTSEELVAAVQAGGAVNITQDITLSAAMSTVGDNLILNGNNNTLDGGNQGRGMRVENDQNFSAENVSFENFTGIDGSSGAGVITNRGTIGSLKNVNFENNSFNSSYTFPPEGGAIGNFGSIGTIENANFSSNTVNFGSDDNAHGGAIYNVGTINEIKNSVFENNQALNGHGGAIYNGHIPGSDIYGKIGSISADFIGNSSTQGGGAIYIVGLSFDEKNEIENIKGSFTNNHAATSGGAIANEHGDIGSIEGTFEKNYVFNNSDRSYTHGGAIYNGSGKIDSIKADFTGNYVESMNAGAQGGAIANSYSGSAATINMVEGNFTDNAAKSTNSYAQGGAIYNGMSSVISISNSTFNGNSVSGAEGTPGSDSGGGAVYNGQGTINSITDSSFESNTSNHDGGAIYNNADSTITNIKDVTFTNNSAENLGGAVYNGGEAGSATATIGDISADFTGNKAQSGGAVYNAYGTIESISGKFSGNTASLNGGAINNGTTAGSNHLIKSVSGEFTENAAQDGGAINVIHGTINNIEGSFTGNHARRGGAIYSETGNFDSIKGNFKNNYTESEKDTAMGGAIYSDQNTQINSLSGNFEGNHVRSGASTAQGGAIYNSSQMGNVSADFTGNSAESESAGADGGAVYNRYSAFGTIEGDFNGNFAKSGSAAARGGAIFNIGAVSMETLNTGFFGNYAQGNVAQGGAIWSSADFTIGADNGKSEFSGNYVITDGEKTANAIWMNNPTTTLTLNSVNNGEILFNDEINGAEGYKLALTGDALSKIDFNNNIRNADITLENTNVNLGNASYLNDNNSLTIASGKMNLARLGSNDTMDLKSLNLSGGELNIGTLDVDLAGKTTGLITAETATVGNGVINVNDINLTTTGSEAETKVQFAGDGLEKAVKSNVTTAMSPVYVYGVRYDNESGEFVFTRPNGDDVKNFNPAVFGGDVLAMSGLNLQSGVVNQISDASDSGLSGSLDYTRARVWATPYLSDDTIDYDNFYDVDSRNYGVIAGVDSKAFRYVNGWSAVYTVFGAYNNGEDKYEGVKVENNSWLLGLKASVYNNGGFYGDAIINYAWHDGKAKTAYGTDSIDATGYGAALKAGYKFNELHNRWKADTSLMLSWQRVNSDDYTSKNGAKIKSDDYSRLTLTPQVKVGYRALKYWTPYALARYNFVLSEDGGSQVNEITMPELESKGYAEYGLGVETANLGNHSGYAHVLRHDGGRSGWSATAGYRYNF